MPFRAMLLALAALLLTVSAGAQGSLVGSYEMHLSGDAGWHRHSLEIRSVEGGRVSGRAALDRGIGPEARMPSPDEKLHLVDFTGEMDASDGSMLFDATAGEMEPWTWSFELYEVEPGTLAGIAEITRPDGATRRAGVVARRAP